MSEHEGGLFPVWPAGPIGGVLRGCFVDGPYLRDLHELSLGEVSANHDTQPPRQKGVYKIVEFESEHGREAMTRGC